MPRRNKDLDITNEKDLSEIIKGIESIDNRNRKRHAWIAHNCLHENQKSYVKKRIEEIYPTTHSKFRIADMLLVKKVITKKNKAYREDPKRTAGDDTETEVYETIVEDGNFLESLKDLDKIIQLHKYGCLWVKHMNPEAEDEDGSYHLQALHPFEFDLVRDEITGEPLNFALSYPDRDTTFGTRFSDGIEEVTSESQADTSAETKIYSIWSNDKFVRVRGTIGTTKEGTQTIKVEILKDEENENNINEAGVLPIVYVQKSSSVDYPLPSNLADQAIEFNVGFTDYKTASAAQGHGILLYKYPDGLKDKKVVLHTGMHTAIDLPQGKKGEAGADAEFINATPQLADQLDGLKFEAINILDDHGIKSGEGFSSGGTAQEFTSALDRIISNADVEDIIIDHQGCYVKAEQRLFSVIRSHENAKNNKVFAESTVLGVTFPKPKVMISDSDTLKNIKERQEQGLDFPYEKHMRIDPNLSVEDAKQREKDIQEAVTAKRKIDVINASKIMDGSDEELVNKKADEEREKNKKV